jgi:hypothetical protein
MTRHERPQHREPLVDAGTGVLAIGALLAGIAIGASGPLFVVSIIVTLVAGPTWGGLALLGAIVLGAVSTVVVIVALVLGHRPYLGVATVVGCAALIAGIYLGASLGASKGLGGWAVAPATPRPAIVMPSFPRYLEAHADVTIQLDGASGFVATPATGGPEGTFGHSCRSGPDSTVVAEVSSGAPEIARRGTSTLHADLYLQDPALIDQASPGTYPRLVLQLGGPSGMTEYAWTGPARVIASEEASGTVAFDALVADPAPPGLPAVLSGQLSWSCRPWSTP